MVQSSNFSMLKLEICAKADIFNNHLAAAVKREQSQRNFKNMEEISFRSFGPTVIKAELDSTLRGSASSFTAENSTQS